MRSYDSAPHPPPSLPSASCLSFSFFLFVSGRAYRRKRRGRGGAKSYDGEKARPSDKSLNTFWPVLFVTFILMILPYISTVEYRHVELERPVGELLYDVLGSNPGQLEEGKEEESPAPAPHHPHRISRSSQIKDDIHSLRCSFLKSLVPRFRRKLGL